LFFLAPSKPPSNIRPVAVTSTSISIAWDSVPCSYRNTHITGYNVSYNIEASGFNITTNLGTTDEKYMKATGLIPGTSYVFIVTPIHNSYDPLPYSGILRLNTTLSEGTLFLML